MERFHWLLITRSQRFTAAAVVFFNVFFYNLVYAAGFPSINASNFSIQVLCPIFNFMFNVLIGIAIIMVTWAGYLYVTAQDDTEKISKAHKTITYAAVAVVVALLAKGFPVLIASVFPQSGGLGSAVSGFC